MQMNQIEARIKPTYISRIRVPPIILEKTALHMGAFAAKGRECMVFWSGKLVGHNEADISSCICPKQRTSSVTIEVPLRATARLHRLLATRQEFLFAQVHSHPGDAFHSATDDMYPITHKPGFISIVVPNFCTEGVIDLARCFVVEYVRCGKWRRLDPSEIERRFVVVDEVDTV